MHESGYHDVVVRQFGQWDQEQQEGFFIAKWFPEKYEILSCEPRQGNRWDDMNGRRA